MNDGVSLPEPAQPAADALRCVLVAVLGCLDAVLLAAAPRFSLRRWVFIACAGPLWRQLNAWRDGLARLIAQLERGMLPPARRATRARSQNGGARNSGATPRERADMAANRRDRPALAVETPLVEAPRGAAPFGRRPRVLGRAEMRLEGRRPPPHPPPWPSAVPISAQPTPRRFLRGGLARAPLVEGAQLPHSPGNHRRRS